MCYLNRTYHVLLTSNFLHIDKPSDCEQNVPARPKLALLASGGELSPGGIFMYHILQRGFLMLAILVGLVAAVPVRAQGSAPPAAPDANLYTTYSLFSSDGETTVDWVVCGSTLDTEGCYDSGSIGPFVSVGAMVEGNPSVKGEVVTREIYVVDSGGSSVKLYVYKKVDTITSTFDTTTVTLSRTLTLPLTGSTTALCSMAANNGFLFIGTNQNPVVVEINKSTFAVTQYNIFEPGINTIAITSDQYGFVTIAQGTPGGDSGLIVFGPNGKMEEDGGGADFMLGTQQGISPAPLLPAAGVAHRTPRTGYHLKPNSPAEAK
jgi:hypothetical protein